eukprot:NODE_1012_length_1712_cov_15.185489_g950_i0.p1 GENE.NODE_1012_length_1712_cov_15.185489_g950_i0~~NODE_1012_length_1712_cov_15.185489_g950_i0.p1  ORF type:complete len:561 (-),score=146.91 NODE_1012_length_1712_cov_15.185489_g950_i0:29-1645(-)
MAEISASTFTCESSPAIREGDFVRSRPPKRGQRAPATASDVTKFDLSSEDALWRSLYPSSQLSEEQRLKSLPIIGVVKRLNSKHTTALVTVWKRGAEFLVQGRPDDHFPLHGLLKLSSSEFHRTCKKPYMQHKQHQLTLKGDGHDDEMPISLIAHNNKLISDLLDRTVDTKVKAQSGLNPIDDPFSGIREELRQVTLDTGVSVFRRSRRKRDSKVVVLHPPTEEPEPEALPSHVAETAFGATQTQGSKFTRLMTSMTSSVAAEVGNEMSKRKNKLAEQMQTDGLLLLGHGAGGLPLTPSTTFLTATPASDTGPLSARAGVYFVEQVHEEGHLLLATCDTDTPLRFMAVLEGVVVPHSGIARLDVRKELSKLVLERKVSATSFGYDGAGNVRMNLTIDGVWTQGLLISKGLARVDASLLDQVEDPEPSVVPKLDAASITALLQAQEHAISRRCGMWERTAATSNFLHPSREKDRSRDTLPPIPLDDYHLDRTVLPALFESHESCQDLRQSLTGQRKRALSRKLTPMNDALARLPSFPTI